MAQGKRVEVSAAQRTEIWRRWKAGESLHEIGRAFGRKHTSIHLLLLHHGGIVPSVRRRSFQALTLAEREDISRGIASGSSIREIAIRLCRATSTVSREVARHGGRSEYRANEADGEAWGLALRPKQCLLGTHERLRRIVVSKLMLDWSPEQVSGWLKIQYPKDESLRVSHETIYRSHFIQARGVLKKSSFCTFGPNASSAARSTRARVNMPRVRSSRPSRSGKGQRRSRTERSQDTGRAISRFRARSGVRCTSCFCTIVRRLETRRSSAASTNGGLK
jgi:hypothetical protein